MKKNIGLYIISISVLIFILAGCSANQRVSNQESKVNNSDLKSLMEKAISIQYGNKDIKETEVFSKNYLDRIPKEQNFYKEQLNPYKILRSNIEEVKSESEENLVVSVRIADKEGEYFQALHMIKIKGSYYIDNIEYDI